MDHAGQIAAAGTSAHEVLDAKHAAREAALVASRRAIRSCATAIRAVHRREDREARELIAVAAAYLAELENAVEGHPDIRAMGYVHDAKKEFAEANLTFAFVAGHAVPNLSELNVDVQDLLNGMAEAASELRRQVLDRLRADDVDEAERLLAVMDDVYAVLITIDYPDAITGGLRRTTDALRAVLERTRGDVTNALVAARLRAAIERQQL
ncbi:MAG: haloacid dehalogenase [Acidimicrobiia bacterium]